MPFDERIYTYVYILDILAYKCICVHTRYMCVYVCVCVNTFEDMTIVCCLFCFPTSLLPARS